MFDLRIKKMNDSVTGTTFYSLVNLLGDGISQITFEYGNVEVVKGIVDGIIFNGSIRTMEVLSRCKISKTVCQSLIDSLIKDEWIFER